MPKETLDLQTCVRCGEQFRANRRRNWCGAQCYEHGRAAILAKFKSSDGGMASVNAGYRAELNHDAKCERETRERVLAWYEARYRERLADGIKLAIPFEAVKIGVLAGTCVFVPGRVVRCLAMVEDRQEFQETGVTDDGDSEQ